MLSNHLRQSLSLKPLLLAVISFGFVLGLIAPSASSLELAQRSLNLSDDSTGVATDYQVNLKLNNTSDSLGSIVFLFCSNTPLIADPCTAPTGLDASGASLISQNGATGFVISPGSNANKLVISRAPAAPAGSDLSYIFSNITNPSQTGGDYLRIITTTGANATGTDTNDGGLAFAITNAVKIRAEVPPYLTFCTGVTITGYDCANARGDYINFGELSSNHTSSSQQQLLAATNAASGYTISLLGNTMTSGNNTIQPLSTNSYSRPGTSQFGLNLVANSNPRIGANPSGLGQNTSVSTGYNQTNSFRFRSGEVVASSSAPANYRKYTVSYIVNVPKKQKPGIYATTITYVALGNF